MVHGYTIINLLGGHPLESTAVRLNARDEEKRSESREWRVESGLERRQPFRWLAVTAAGTGGTYARFRELNTVDVAESNCYWDVPAEIDWTGTIVSVQLPRHVNTAYPCFPLSVSRSERSSSRLFAREWPLFAFHSHSRDIWIFTMISFYRDVDKFYGYILYVLRGIF